MRFYANHDSFENQISNIFWGKFVISHTMRKELVGRF